MSETISSNDTTKESVPDQMGGKRRKNGHKYSCACPICINIKHAKRGGDNDILAQDKGNEITANVVSQLAGEKKKSNGHKLKCSCPICKNMTKKKRNIGVNKLENYGNNNDDISNISGGSRKKNTKSFKRNHKKNCPCPICKNMRKKRGGGEDTKKKDGMETEALDSEYDNVEDISNIAGGTRRKKSRKSRRNKKSRRNRINK